LRIMINCNMAKSIFPETPLFIPRAMDAQILGLGLRFPAIIMGATMVELRAKIADGFKMISDIFIIDPETHKLLYKQASQKKAFKKISYPDVEFEKIYSNLKFRSSVIDRCIQYQIKKGASILIAPYFFSDDVEDNKFSLNITLLAETIKYIQDKKIDLQLFAMVYVGTQALARTATINFIADRYTNEFSNYLGGYFVAVSDIDGRKSSSNDLLGFAYLIYRLSLRNHVIVNSVGDFGGVLSAIGAIGFSSSLMTGESISVKLLQAAPKKMKSRVKEWTYVPEIFNYANDAEVKKIGYKCPCPACKNSFPVGATAKKQHFFFRRMSSMEELRLIDPSKRLDYMAGRISDAKKLVVGYVKRFKSPFKTDYLDRWEEVLRVAAKWAPPEDEDELSAIIAELE